MTRDEEVKYAFAELHQTFYDALNALMEKVDARARAEEREACAKLVENYCGAWDDKGYALAQAIRTKGEKL